MPTTFNVKELGHSFVPLESSLQITGLLYKCLVCKCYCMILSGRYKASSLNGAWQDLITCDEYIIKQIIE